MLGCAGIEQRIKPIERVPAAWDFQQRIERIAGCSENPINQINPLWKKYIVRVRRNLTRIERIERIVGCGENQINQINPL